MHALEGLVSIAAEGASSIQGGNRLIFENFANRSQADVKLAHKVVSVTKLDGSAPEWIVTNEHWKNGELIQSSSTYDAVMLAAPLHSTNIAFHNTDIVSQVPKHPYVHLFVTIAITNATAPRGCYFNKAWSCDPIGSTTILSTFSPYEKGNIATAPRINSLNYLRTAGDGQWVVKSQSS